MRRRFLLGMLLAPLQAFAQPDPLWRKMNRFAATWGTFKKAYDLGVFDYASAKRLSQEWREVENSGEWPKDYSSLEGKDK